MGEGVKVKTVYGGSKNVKINTIMVGRSGENNAEPSLAVPQCQQTCFMTILWHLLVYCMLPGTLWIWIPKKPPSQRKAGMQLI